MCSPHFYRYSVEDTGPVSSIAWTPDNSAFAAGWKFRGLTVWSVSGCRLMSTIRQIGLSSITSPMGKTNQDSKHEPLMSGVSLMQWDEFGYRLFAIEERSLETILVFSFGKCCLNRGVSGMTYVRQVIYGEDRLLVVQSEDTNALKMLHLNLPVGMQFLVDYCLWMSRLQPVITLFCSGAGFLYFSKLASSACGSKQRWNVHSCCWSPWVDIV